MEEVIQGMTSQSSKSGMPPGTLIPVGEGIPSPTVVRVCRYNKSDFSDDIYAPDELSNIPLSDETVTWIHLSGLATVNIIQTIGSLFQIHPLTLEDILNTNHRPKIEDYDDYLYCVLRIVRSENDTIQSEQFSLILQKNCLISFQERENDTFDNVRRRIAEGKGKIRSLGPDYLLYALTDTVVDEYFPVFEKIGADAEDLEEAVIERPDPSNMEEIYTMKRDLIHLRKHIWPEREVLSSLLRGRSDLISEPTLRYFGDVADHLFQIADMLETYREMVTGLYEIYLSTLSNRMNEVMKVLTIIATIFIPLTFIAGLYGMNFAEMPELTWEYGYPAALLSMVAVAIVMILFFRKKGWV